MVPVTGNPHGRRKPDTAVANNRYPHTSGPGTSDDDR